MRNPDVIIIGGGQAGLVMSRSLSARGIDHIVLERGRIGEHWHSQRWHSLSLLTTAEMSALPGLPHAGDPETFMPAAAFARYLATYAERMAVPIVTGVTVLNVARDGPRFRVFTDAGEWMAGAVVVATGACDTPFRPPIAENLASSIVQLSCSHYREPAQLPPDGVLVVGASSSGVQLAEEIHASGRRVILAVGDHSRAPRRYRGVDFYKALDIAGILDQPPQEGANIDRARRQPSLQLIGCPDRRDLNIGTLQRQGIRVLGRLAGMDGVRATFSGDLARTTAVSHDRMLRTLGRIDTGFEQAGLDAPPADPQIRVPILADREAATVNLSRERIRSVVWATGYARRYPWLKVPVLDDRGEIVHRGGITAVPGLYAMGLNFMRRRRSSFIDGCGRDAEDLAPLVKGHLDRSARRVA